MAKKDSLTYDLSAVIPDVDLQELYGWQVLDAKQVRAVVRVETTQGVFALKKVSHKPAKLQFLYEAQEHLWNNGFQTLSRFVKTLDGKPFVDLGDELLFVNTWLDGEEMDVKSPEHLREVVRLQARLHQASRGFKASVQASIKTRWAGWIERYEDQLNDIHVCYDRLKGHTPQTELETVFLETVEPMLELAEKGVELLKESPYQEVLYRERQLSGFVHGDFTYHNFIRSPEGVMQVIDFDYCAHELRAHDFARFMRKMLRRKEWSPEIAETILRTYHEVDPLHEDELHVLKAVLYFPQRYWRAVERGFLSHRYSPEGSVKKMRQEVAKLDEWKRCLDAFPTRL
ncbi:CotS family spore coat protein [Tumebacillus permanentifrigoris]|uniref:CotS family spore coat protein n=1 Tax=Tumebacillus permanentifrigoris TaxID=378543 RepID=A0A316DC67_9BACL|nr:CotS family spore coat protein [Tumebacillus permanentifrigoris]PWK15801.1 CotS family spore coat protein [Tumebacillus permanentifrigoris]